MNTVARVFLLIALISAPLGAKADKYSEALMAFKSTGETGAYFSSAYGYALFPTIGKAGIGIGGAGGKGKVYAGGKHVGNTKMAQVTYGLQLGGQAFSEIIFFQDKRAFDNFTAGNFEFSAEASAVAITAGASAQSNTGGGSSASASAGQSDASLAGSGYHKGMKIFTIAKGGLMYEAVLGGQKFSYEAL